MIKMLPPFLILLLLIVFTTKTVWGSSVKKKEQILWVVGDTYEWDDYEKGNSVSTSQDTTAIIITALLKENYDLSFIKASGERLNHFLKNYENVCISNRLKTPEREKYSLYSIPHDLYLGLQIYRLKQPSPLTKNIFNNNGKIISISDLFKHYPNQLLGVSGGISYGSEIDHQLTLLKKENLFIRYGGLRLISLAKMFFFKRIDYLIFYPTDMDKLLAKMPVEVESYKLSNVPPYMLGYVACSKSDFGAKVINKINNILNKKYSTKEFYQAHSKWVPKSDLETLNLYFKEVFIHNDNKIKTQK